MTNIWDKVLYVRQFKALKKFEAMEPNDHAR